MPPLLSIAIPTFQRKHWLQKNLTGILSQLGDQPAGLVEIIVSENAGQDGAWEYLQQLAVENPSLILNRNSANIGAEGNIYLLPSLASGTYLWILGDDDFLEPGALNEIVAELLKAPDYIVVNFAVSDESMTRKAKRHWTLDTNKSVGSLGECCEYVPHFVMGFLSAWIARKELFNRIDEKTYRYFSKWGLSVMLDRYMGAAVATKGLVLARAMLLNRKPPVSDYPATFEYFSWFFAGSSAVFEFLQAQIRLEPKIIRARKAWLLKKIAIRRILFERATGVLDVGNVNSILFSGYSDRWEYWLGCLPALYFPGLGLLAAAALRLTANRQRKAA